MKRNKISFSKNKNLFQTTNEKNEQILVTKQ